MVSDFSLSLCQIKLFMDNNKSKRLGITILITFGIILMCYFFITKPLFGLYMLGGLLIFALGKGIYNSLK